MNQRERSTTLLNFELRNFKYRNSNSNLDFLDLASPTCPQGAEVDDNLCPSPIRLTTSIEEDETGAGNERLPLTISFFDLSCFYKTKIPFWRRMKDKMASKSSTPQNSAKDLSDGDNMATEMKPVLKSQPILLPTSTVTHTAMGQDYGENIILHPFSGCLKPGELLAVMGPSGSGKTTFLEAVSYRIAANRIRGEIMVNGIPINDEISRKCFGFVWQHDALHENLTVRETLEYVCRLRFNYSMDKVKVRVKEVLDELGLNNCANTRIGGQSFRGISGGERKRVSIAIELLANPSVLFLDEPTTGLDSFTALHIVQTLKNLAAKNRTVICTIHQPQTSIFRSFDRILLMSQGGRVAYFGAGGDQAVNYFEQLGFQCDEFTNPSDHFLDIINTFPKKRKHHHAKQRKRQSIDGEAAAELSITMTPTTASPGIPSFYNELTADGRVEFLVHSYTESQLCKQNRLEAEESIRSNIDEMHCRQESEVSINSATRSPSDSISACVSQQTLGVNSLASSMTALDAAIATTSDSNCFSATATGTTTALSSNIPTSPAANQNLTSPTFDALKRSFSLPFMAMTRKRTINTELHLTAQKNSPNWFTKFWVLSLRQFKDYGRNKTATVFRLLQSVLIAAFIGLIYFGVGFRTDQKAAQDRRGVLFFLSLQQAMLGSITVTTLFHGWERIIFQREYASSLYDVGTYYASKFLAEIPFQVISPLLFGVITYFMIGLSQTFQQFSIFMACIILTTFCGQAMGMAISVFSPNMDIANILLPLLLALTMVCGGFFITVSTLPSWLYWTTQIDFVTYSNQILAVNDLTGLNFTCDTIASPTATNLTWGQKFWYGVSRPFRKAPTVADIPPQYLNGTIAPCIVKTGEDMLKSMSFDNVNISFAFLVILLMTVGLHILALIGLRFNVAGKFRK